MESEVLSAFNGDTVFVVHEGSKSQEFMHLSVIHDDPKFLEVVIVHGVCERREGIGVYVFHRVVGSKGIVYFD